MRNLSVLLLILAVALFAWGNAGCGVVVPPNGDGNGDQVDNGDADNGDTDNGDTDDGDTDDGDTDDGDTDDGDDMDDGDDGTDDGDDQGQGDPAAGAAIYIADCASCHGEDGQGSTPLNDVSYAAVETRFGGGANHGGATLNEQEILDVAAWLATLQ